MYTHIENFIISKYNYSEVVTKFDSEPSLIKINGSRATYEIPVRIQMRYPIRILTKIKLEENSNNDIVIKAYSNLIKPIFIILLAMIAASLVLILVYDIPGIMPLLLFSPFLLFVIFDTISQVKKILISKLALLLHK